MNMLEQIYKENVNSIYRYAYAQLGNKTDAEDITSFAFTKLIEQQDLNKIINIKFWLLAVARNKIINNSKKITALPEFENEMQQVIDLEPSHESIQVQEEVKKQLEIELKSLDAIERELITLKVWEEMKFSEIAELLDIKESNAKALYYKALQKIKKSLESKQFKVMAAIPLLLSALTQTAKAAVFVPSSSFTNNLLNITMKEKVGSLTQTTASPISTKVMLGLGSVIILGIGVITGIGVSQPKNPQTNITPQSTSIPTTIVSQTTIPSNTLKPMPSIIYTKYDKYTDWRQIDMTSINAKISFPNNWYYTYQNSFLHAGTQEIPESWDEGLSYVFGFTSITKDSNVYKKLINKDPVETWTFKNGKWKVYNEVLDYQPGFPLYRIAIIHEDANGKIYLLSNDTDSSYSSSVSNFLKPIAAMAVFY